VPAVAITVPEGWASKPVPGALIAVSADRGAGVFSPNVVVTHSREVGATWEQVEAHVTSYLDTLVDPQEIDRQRVVLGGRRWTVVEFAHSVPEAGTVIQVLAATLVELAQVTDVVRLIGSLSATEHENDLPVVRAAIASAVVTPR